MPSPFTVTPAAKPIRMTYLGEAVDLSPDARARVEAHWAKAAAANPHLTRGDVFAVTSCVETAQAFEITAMLSDFAHYLYYRREPQQSDDPPCRVAFSPVLAETADGFLILGEMAAHTVSAGKLQCPGGGLTRDNLAGDRIDIAGNAAKELLEETGLRHDNPAHVAACRFAYLITGGSHKSIAAVYHAALSVTAQEAQAIFTRHNASLDQSGEPPEFVRLVMVPNTPGGIEEFLARALLPMNEYVPPLLRAHAAYVSR